MDEFALTYKEYKAEEPKVLLNIDSFNYCGYSLCNPKTSLNYIEVEIDDAVYINSKYENIVREQNLNNTDEINGLKSQLIEELISKGYDVNNKVEPIIHK